MSDFRHRAHGKSSAVIDLTSDDKITIDDDEDEITIVPGPFRASSTTSRNPRSSENVSTYNPPSSLNVSRNKIHGRNYVDRSRVEMFRGSPIGPPVRKKKRTPIDSTPNTSGASSRAGSSSARPTSTFITISDDDEPPPLEPAKRERQHLDSIPSSSRVPISNAATAPANCSLKRKRGQAEPSAAGSPRPAPPPKNSIFHRLLTPPLFDKEVVQGIADEEQYDNFHAGFDTSNPDRWKPVKHNENKVTILKSSPKKDGPLQSTEVVKEAKRIERNRQFRVPDIGRPTFTSALRLSSEEGKSRPGPFIWDLLNTAENYRWSRSQRPRPLAIWEYGRARDSLKVAVDLHGLKRTTSFKECPGSIVCVEQKHGWVAIAGASIGGAEDTPDEVPDIYNREGSLITWYSPREKQITPLLGHQALRNGVPKYYGIHDVKFCPSDLSFVSSANDRCVHVWESSRPPYHDRSYKLHKFETTPHALAFKPGTSILAVAEKSVFVFPDLKRESQPLQLKGGNNYPNHVVGAVCWGREATSNYIFASGEPTDTETFSGWHRAFDAEVGGLGEKMDASEAGDAIAIDSLGTKLALATRVSDSGGVLRLYDIQRKTFKKAHTKIELEPYRRDIEGEIHDAALSPDGVYLALARHDNRTHVYDSRFLGKGVLYDFRHDSFASKTVPGAESCGVMKLQWVISGSRLGLVSGGSDGCIRLWDPLQAASDPQNGVIVAEVNSDIATFSLGDRFKGEHQLVVGDCTGEVTIFDRFYESDFALNIAP